MSTTTNAFPAFQPLGIGQLLDQAMRLYRQNFWRFIGIFALVQVPLMLLQTVVTAVFTTNLVGALQADPTAVTPGEMVGSFLPGYVANLFVGILSFLLVQGVATAALTQSIADGRVGISTGILDSYRKIRPIWPKLIGALLLLSLIALGFFIWFLIPCVGWVSGLGLLVICFAISQIVAPIVVIERQRARAALRRAWDLIRRRFWWVIGFLSILLLFSILVVSGPSLLVSGGLGALLGNTMDIYQMTVLRAIISSLVSLITSLLYLPLQLTAATLLYFDLRVRTEGLDLAADLQQASGAEIELGLIDGLAPQPGKEPIITSKEVGYIVLLTILAGVLYGIFITVITTFSFLMVGLGSGF